MTHQRTHYPLVHNFAVRSGNTQVRRNVFRFRAKWRLPFIYFYIFRVLQLKTKKIFVALRPHPTDDQMRVELYAVPIQRLIVSR